jgi:murein DD-endopeptidase MepM/ murein hydrolase activator NlpD
MKMKTFIIIFIAGVLIGLGLYVFRSLQTSGARGKAVFAWIRSPEENSPMVIQPLTRCGDAPFLFPTHGVIGFIWDDSFRIGHHHSGLDIFAGTAVNITPVYAAYDGYLTRLPDWKSAVILRIPQDPIDPSRQIWIYYAHMADNEGNSFIDSAFPAGTSEIFIKAGTLLGLQGNYSGDPSNPVGVHLHISIVKDEGGHFMNETNIKNTYDPSPYFGMELNAHINPSEIPVCKNIAP